MSKRASAWMRFLTVMILPSFVIGCVNAGSADAICAGTKAARADHAKALADDGGDRSVASGAHLIWLLDAGCDDVG